MRIAGDKGESGLTPRAVFHYYKSMDDYTEADEERYALTRAGAEMIGRLLDDTLTDRDETIDVAGWCIVVLLAVNAATGKLNRLPAPLYGADLEADAEKPLREEPRVKEALREFLLAQIPGLV